MSDAGKREVWLVRHGQTPWSLTGQHTGRSDIPLTAVGVREAAALAERIAAQHFALVLTSPLQRARETCRLAGLAPAAVPDDDLLEWDYGDCEGRTSAEIRREHPGWTVWSGPLPGGETAEQVGERADRLLARVHAAASPVALFGHGHMLRVLASRWLGFPARYGQSFALDTASVSILGTENRHPVLRTWNQVCR